MEENTIKNLVIKYCQHISHPIYLWTENSEDHWLQINNWLNNRERVNNFATKKFMNHIPDDLVFSIISNLPFKSLKRFGCLQRSWTLLFENSHFMNLFRNNFICNHHSYYDDTSLILSTVVPYPNNMKSTLFSISGENFQNMEKLYFPDQLQEDYHYGYGILDSVNGILCLYQLEFGKHLAYLWNPTTNEIKVIPPSPVEFVPHFIIPSIHYHGFGYDSVTDDYKVIRQVGTYPAGRECDDIRDSFDFRSLPREWQMYSLKSDSWKKLELEYFSVPPLRYQTNENFYFEGMCHWLGYHERPKELLVSFDLENEVCITTPVPLDIPMEIYDNFDMYYVNTHLLLLNGSIALMSSYDSDNTFYISILGEVGNKETWTKLFVFEPTPPLAFSIGAWYLGNIVFQTHDGDLAWFDLSTHTVQKLGIKVHGGDSQLVVYKKSLLPIEGINN